MSGWTWFWFFIACFAFYCAGDKNSELNDQLSNERQTTRSLKKEIEELKKKRIPHSGSGPCTCCVCRGQVSSGENANAVNEANSAAAHPVAPVGVPPHAPAPVPAPVANYAPNPAQKPPPAANTQNHQSSSPPIEPKASSEPSRKESASKPSNEQSEPEPETVHDDASDSEHLLPKTNDTKANEESEDSKGALLTKDSDN